MYIRKTRTAELDTVCKIYNEAREFMRVSGNAQQWGDEHPPRALIEQDIRDGKSYVCVDGQEHILAVFYFAVENDPTYNKIDGQWLSDEPYGVVHRIARGSKIPAMTRAPSVGEFCLNWCYEQCHNLRVDTHRDNAPMKNLLERLGFRYCGIIWIGNGEERLAYQRR